MRYAVATASHTAVSAGYAPRTAKLEQTFKSNIEAPAVSIPLSLSINHSCFRVTQKRVCFNS